MLIPVTLPAQTFALAATSLAHRQDARQSMVTGGLRVVFDGAKRDEVEDTLVFTGHVIARYKHNPDDPDAWDTVIECDELTIWQREQRGRAVGETKITDPDGFASCHKLDFNWKTKSGDASDVSVYAAGARLHAETMHIEPKKWVLSQVVGTLSRYKTPAYKVHAESVTISPGDQGTAHRVFLEVFGRRIGPIANVDFNLDQRVTGFKTPNITNKRGSGIGVAWDSSVLLTDKSAVGAVINSFPRTSPEAILQYSFSPLDPGSSPFSLAPRSELQEFAGDGWFDSVNVKSLAEEEDTLGQKRQSYGVSTRINQDTVGRSPDALNVTQPLDLAAEYGGRTNGFGYLFTGHVQRVREDREEPWVDRLLFQGTLKAPSVRFGQFSVVSRFDVLSTASNRGQFAFGRAEAGLVYRPLEGFDIGVGVGYGAAIGTADFAYDRMPYDKSLLARLDYSRGPFTARLIWKWDLETRVLYDREYEFALVADGFEPFISSRKFPGDFRIGVRFRMDGLVDRLSKREVKRETRKQPAP
ncbi:MAG: hypothetical protein JSS65_06075 [Armatimonadetes bacterium]|nr:hypothetical protein [Armatimonadota bacterium]